MALNCNTERRIIVVGLVWNQENQLLLCKMVSDRGVFPDQWGLPGGGLEPDENMTDALRRELKEEIGVEIDGIRPAFFKDGTYRKAFADGSKRDVYMIFLVFHCRALDSRITLNEEFSDYRWVSETEIRDYQLNTETLDTLEKIGDWDSIWIQSRR